MEQKKELKVYLFEATRTKKNEDGTLSDERETFASGYAFEGDPRPRVDYNRYWEFGDGSLNLVSKDGKAVDSDLDPMFEWVYGFGFRRDSVLKMVDGLDAPGKWAEACLGDAVGTTLRIIRREGLPEIDPAKTIEASDLMPVQQHRVLIDGAPLFPDGGTVSASDPRTPTLVLRSGLPDELNKVWEEVIRARSGIPVRVKVDTNYNSGADSACVCVKLTVETATRDGLNGALRAIGVLDPGNVAPDIVVGEGSEPNRFVATVILATEV